MNLLAKLNYRCTECGKAFSTVHIIKNNEFLAKINKLGQKCPRCKHSILPTIETYGPPYFTVAKFQQKEDPLSIQFLGSDIIMLEKNVIRVDIGHLMSSGYGGVIEITDVDGSMLEQINIDTIRNSLTKSKRTVKIGGNYPLPPEGMLLPNPNPRRIRNVAYPVPQDEPNTPGVDDEELDLDFIDENEDDARP